MSRLSNGYVKNVKSITYTCSRNLMQATVRSMTTKRDLASCDIEKHCKRLQRVCSVETFHLVRRRVHELNSRIYKERKFAELCGKCRDQQAEINSSNTQDDHDYQSKLIVTIPDDLPLCEAEKLVLSKGLTFVPVKKSTDEYSVKAYCEKFYRCLCLRVHFHNEETSEPCATPSSCDPICSPEQQSRPEHHQRVNSQR